ncbi:MAG: ribose 5-phosphate isomerase B [Bacteroidia bacterium]|nr:ribose 5-phosphate isomerase B [Bacteroidia bacterium]HQV00087.1 ribose 5-phosphate isomerase B [Bacteroidia bacterium]
MQLYIGADHAGFQLKETIKSHLVNKGYTVIDKGTFSETSTDYPPYAHEVAIQVANQNAMGILICGSANGVCITANKHAGVRAALCWQTDVATLARQHNDANIICIPARFVTNTEALSMVDVFLNTPFEGGRHANRVAKINIQ